jgi:ATP-dependent DNA ligase
MAAATVADLPAAPGWVFEPKFDGFRALAFCDAAGLLLQSRQLRPLAPAFPDVAAALAPFTHRGVVLDGELVVWRRGRFDFPALQDRLRSGPARVRELAAATPAAYVVFDLLARDGADLRERPYTTRRRELEELLAEGMPPGLVLAPATADPAVARTWLRGYTGSGIEGVVAKRADQPYRPGVRGWQKLRARVTGEAVVGGVIGRVGAPQVLLLGRYDDAGRLQVAGRTTELHPAARAAVGAVLRPHPGPGHPWPETLPRSRYGRRPAEPLSYTRVHPRTVVELVVDPALDGPRWRHPARFLRLRPDLHPGDLGAAAPDGAAHDCSEGVARWAER